LPRLAKTVYGGTRTRRFEEFGAWQRTKSEVKLNINWKIGRRLGVKGYGSRIQDFSTTKLTQGLASFGLARSLPITLLHLVKPNQVFGCDWLRMFDSFYDLCTSFCSVWAK
jgi:hypothetical protein